MSGEDNIVCQVPDCPGFGTPHPPLEPRPEIRTFIGWIDDNRQVAVTLEIDGDDLAVYAAGRADEYEMWGPPERLEPR